MMDLHEVQTQLNLWLNTASHHFQKVPGSAVLIRYVRASYQNDPVRSAVELVLVIFFIRYLLSPSYSTSKQNFIKLTEDVSDHAPSLRLPSPPVMMANTAAW
jgi:serine palmitoyltransferase